MSQDGDHGEPSGAEGASVPAAPLVPRRPLRISDEPSGEELREGAPAPSLPATLREPSAPPPPRRMPSIPAIAEPPAALVVPESVEVEAAEVEEKAPDSTEEIEHVEAVEAVAEPTPTEVFGTIEADDFSETTPLPALNRAAEIVSQPPPSLEVAPASAQTTEETLAMLEDDAVVPEVEPEPETPAAPVVDRRPPPPQRSMKPALPTAATPKKKPWWEEVFGDDFSRGHRGLGPEAARIEVNFIASQLGLERGAVLLDLCCGQGELTVELNRRGYSVVGYDLSVYQLAMAGDNAQNAKQKINFLQGDMREMAFESMFDAVICWDTSFGYFEEDKNVEVARRIFNAVKPGGSLLLDILNRDHVAMNSPHNHWFEGDGCICMDDMQLDWITSRLKVKRSIILDDGRSKELTFSIRLYTLSEIGKLLHSVGFRVAAVSGHPATPGAFLGPQSPRIIIRADRPE